MSGSAGQFIAGLSGLHDALAAWLMPGALVFLRIGAAMAVLPAFGDQVVPMRLRLGLTLAFTLLVTPAVGMPIAPAGPDFLAALGPEVVAGLAIGMVLRLMVMALQLAGTIAAQSVSLSQFFGGAGPDPQPAMAQILMLGGLCLATIAGLHVRLAEYLILSYAILPLGLWPDPGELAQLGIARTARMFALAFTLAGPFVIAALVYNMALGAINRAMPQLMVVFIGAPALTAGGLVLLAVMAPPMLGVWAMALWSVMEDPTGLAP